YSSARWRSTRKRRAHSIPRSRRSSTIWVRVDKVQSRFDEAEPLIKRSLLIREKALGPDHPDVARSLNNLADLYQRQRRYTEALPLFQRALAIRERAVRSSGYGGIDEQSG